MRFIDEDMKLAVKHGAQWLDENYPRWAELIRLDALEMADCQSCIVGQAMGEYSAAIAHASGKAQYSQETYDWSVEHGFDVAQDVFERSHGDTEYRNLEVLWTEEVRKRLG